MFELFDPDLGVRISTGAALPHWYQAGATYFITFRTADSIPADVSKRWHAERSAWLHQRGISASDPDWQRKIIELPEDRRVQYYDTFPKQFLDALDKGHGECVLRRRELAKIVADSLLHFDGDRYQLGDFVVMPNHVHLLVCLHGETDVVKQCYSWKKFTATKINKTLGRSGRFWQEESFDHLVRTPAQLDAIRHYIRKNPSGLREGEFYLHET